ncbi:MAG: DNA cytosine methyltransferase [Sphingomonadales bacterium]|nr:DNA cytosine methyltransferase [Sphingomonadales bacterium]
MLDVAVGLVTGARSLVYIEREAYAAATLVARMEDQALDPAPVWSDMRTFDGRPYRGLVDILISGDPCQGNSLAGKRRGQADGRDLIDELVRIIDEMRPACLFRENVPGNAHGQFGAIVPPLEGLGYELAAGIFSAADAGASHRRERLFVMAYNPRWGRAGIGVPKGQGGEGTRTSIAGRCGTKLAESGSVEHAFGQGVGSDVREEFPATSGGGGAVVDASIMRRTKGQPQQPGRLGLAALEQHGLPIFAPGPTDPRWPEILQLDPSVEPALCGMADGMAARVDRLRLAGNGVCPLQAAVAFCSLAATLGVADRFLDPGLVRELGSMTA